MLILFLTLLFQTQAPALPQNAAIYGSLSRQLIVQQNVELKIEAQNRLQYRKWEEERRRAYYFGETIVITRERPILIKARR